MKTEGWFRKAKIKWAKKRLFSWRFNDGSSWLEWHNTGSRGALEWGWDKDEHEQIFLHVYAGGFVDGFWLARHITLTRGTVEASHSKNYLHGKPFRVSYRKVEALTP